MYCQDELTYMSPGKRPIYLDCNATTPVEPKVAEVAKLYLEQEFGNAGSRTHEYGAKAKSVVARARSAVAELLGADDDEVIFTSGATEANNMTILGLGEYGQRVGKRHLITSAQEHKAVLEPIEKLVRRGFEVTVLKPGHDGVVSPNDLCNALRPDTLLVSLMHVNNETGVIQPIRDYSKLLMEHSAYFHVDAAQSFGKLVEPLRNRRIDLISVSGHKVYAPKGVGVLLARCRDYDEPPLEPLMYGGGQEKGMRPGTLPVHLIAALGEAVRLASKDHTRRLAACAAMKVEALQALSAVGGIVNGGAGMTLASTLNISFPGLDSEALILQLKEFFAISNGSACTSSNYSFSHVLSSMGLSNDRIRGAIRISWSHMTPPVDWALMAGRIAALRK
jgi:cysteine desulfurase